MLWLDPFMLYKKPLTGPVIAGKGGRDAYLTSWFLHEVTALQARNCIFMLDWPSLLPLHQTMASLYVISVCTQIFASSDCSRDSKPHFHAGLIKPSPLHEAMAPSYVISICVCGFLHEVAALHTRNRIFMPDWPNLYHCTKHWPLYMWYLSARVRSCVCVCVCNLKFHLPPWKVDERKQILNLVCSLQSGIV